MKYYNIHTHHIPSNLDNKSTGLIYNLTAEEIVLDIKKQDPSIYYSCGIHPWHIGDSEIDILDLHQLVQGENKIVAIGEAGLDKLTETALDIQQAIFIQQIELAIDLNLPMIIHCVKAWDELIALYRKYKPLKPWIIHGFRGGREQAEQLKSSGFYFSLGEFYNPQCLTVIYPNHLFLETDDSKVDIEKIYGKIANELDCDIQALRIEINQNVSEVFDLSCF